MKTTPFRFLLACAGLVSAGFVSAQTPAPAGSWKTIYYKRVFLGNYESSWVGGATTVLRQPLVIPVEGTKARVWMRSMRDMDATLAHVSLAPGVDGNGVTDGRHFPVTFAGAVPVRIPAKAQDFPSDDSPVPLKPGTWYLQQNYTSDKFIYTQDNDGAYRVATPDQATPAPGSFIRGSALGNVMRIDMFSPSPKAVIACYGDSITQGLGATPGSGNRYPDLLARKTGRPVLNLGVNGDLARHSRGLPLLLNTVEGVDTVVFLIGINDIISGVLTDAKDYATNITSVAEGVKQAGRRFYLGTIPPAGGYAKYDDMPEKEELRQAVNAWIRASTVADGIIDFDVAVSNPVNSTRMRADCQSDWLHPNDEGYRRMAAAAAAVIQ